MSQKSTDKTPTVPQSPQSQEENSSGDSSDSTSSCPEVQNKIKSPPATTSSLTQAGILKWNSTEEENYAATPNDAFLTSLSNGAIGKRTGGEPSRDRVKISNRGRKVRLLASRGASMRTVRKRPPVAAGTSQSGTNALAFHEYQCHSCMGKDVRPLGKQYMPAPTRHSTPPEEQKRYECQDCGGRAMERRGIVKKRIGGIWRPVFTVSSGESVSRAASSGESCSSGGTPVVPLKRKRQNESEMDKPKRIKREPVETKEDSIDHFGKYMAALLRSVPRKRGLRLQKEIISLILDDRMKPSDASD